MPRVTYVKHARQRYATVPVLNEDGTQKATPRLRKDGTPVTTKTGRETVLRLTAQDRSKPLPMPKCEACGTEVKPGDPYKHVTPKSGPWGGQTRVRCSTCPVWNSWDLSNALWARIEQITTEWDTGDFETPDDVTSALQGIAEQVRDLAEEKREGAQNIEDGFGHPTSQSEELAETADTLDSWADDIENVDVPELPDPDDVDCETCSGTGEVIDPDSDEEAATTDETPKIGCPDCGGTGHPSEPTDEQMDEWRQAVEDACSIVTESPV